MPNWDAPQNRPLLEVERQAAELETKAIWLAEANKLEEAEALLMDAIKMAPNYPSPYNNLAQLHRLMKQPSETIIANLNRAIELATEFPIVRRQALCQRGLITGHQEDFAQAARLGSPQARHLAVECNPYAKLCSAMVKQVMTSLYFSHPL